MRGYLPGEHFLMQYSVQMSADTVMYERVVYDLLAFIGDCGGFYGGMVAIM